MTMIMRRAYLRDPFFQSSNNLLSPELECQGLAAFVCGVKLNQRPVALRRLRPRSVVNSDDLEFFWVAQAIYEPESERSRKKEKRVGRCCETTSKLKLKTITAYCKDRQLKGYKQLIETPAFTYHPLL